MSSSAGTEWYTLPSSDPQRWTWVQTELQQTLADEDALMRCVRRCEHRSRTGRPLDEEEESAAAARNDDDDDSPRPFSHPPLPSLHYFLRDHLGQPVQQAATTTQAGATAESSSADAITAKQRFFQHTLPVLQQAALAMPTLFPDGRLRRLRADPSQGSEAHFSRRQLLCLLAHMFFCTLDKQCVCYWPNYGALYDWWKSDAIIAYLHTLVEYFAQRCDQWQAEDHALDQTVTVKRAALSPAQSATADAEALSSSRRTLCAMELVERIDPSRPGSYAGADQILEVDFAHSDISFGRGGTQEELLLGMSPETHVLPLLLESVTPAESVSIRAAQRVGTFRGFGCEVYYTGPFCLQQGDSDAAAEALDAAAAASTTGRIIVAMDAANLWERLGDLADEEYDSSATRLRLLQLQCQPDVIRRDLVKAFVAMDASSDSGLDGAALAAADGSTTAIASAPAISSAPASSSPPRRVVWTGTWGCNSFGGNLHVKFLAQWLAASLSGVARVRYQHFGQAADFAAQADALVHKLQAQSGRATVGLLWRCLQQFAAEVSALPPLAPNDDFDVGAVGQRLFDAVSAGLDH